MEQGSGGAVHCFVYRSARKDETYVYLRERDGFDVLPEALRRVVGRLDLVMELDLEAHGRLARADVGQVIAALAEQGFYLQMPPPPESLLDTARA